nr:methyl-accepting chemotaxis protein [Nevskia soli]
MPAQGKHRSFPANGCTFREILLPPSGTEMKNLKVWQKLVLMGAVFMVPFAVVTYKMVASINTLGVEFARQELRGLEYYRPLLVLLRDLQQHRAMAAAGGDPAVQAALPVKGADIENDLKTLEGIDQRLDGFLHTGKKLAALSIACREMLAKSAGQSSADSFAAHSKVIDSAIALVGDVSDASNLTLDPDVDSYYLMDVVMFQAPELSEHVGQAGAPSAVFSQLPSAAVLADYLRKQVDQSLGKALDFNAALKPQLAADGPSAAERAAAGVIKLFAGRRSEPSPAEAFGAVSSGLAAIFDMEQRATEALNGLLVTRIAKLRGDIYATLGWALLGLLVVMLIGVFIMRDITVALGRMVGWADRIGTGDLSLQVAVETRRDEIGMLSHALSRMTGALKNMAGAAEQIAAGNLAVRVEPQSDRDVMGKALGHMVEGLSALVGQVQKSGIQVNSSLTQIAATAREQQATASEIAATTTEIGATSREISATSKELVRTMQEVSGVAEHSAVLAGQGQSSLARMEDTMHNVMAAATSINDKLGVLNEKAGNINQVVTTITKVADQTNLLSLNAAIEAEKAGEYGRGFSVVATEIRRLADQTAVATYDIEQTVKEIQSAVTAGVMGMDKFSDQVHRGMQEVQQAGGQLSQIIRQVQDLAPRFELVNEGMQAQATGAEQISEALSQLSEAAQQTVDSLRQSTEAIDGLNQVSTALRNGISRFRLEG